MRRITAYEAKVYNPDGPNRHVGYFTTANHAREAAQIHGAKEFVNGYVEPEAVEFIIFDTFEEFERHSLEAIRKRALAKLDDDELKVLGLKR
jgi:hypothetical protein